MRIDEIIVNHHKRLIDEISGYPVSGMIYEFHDNVSNDSSHFTKPIIFIVSIV